MYTTLTPTIAMALMISGCAMIQPSRAPVATKFLDSELMTIVRLAAPGMDSMEVKGTS